MCVSINKKAVISMTSQVLCSRSKACWQSSCKIGIFILDKQKYLPGDSTGRSLWAIVEIPQPYQRHTLKWCKHLTRLFWGEKNVKSASAFRKPTSVGAIFNYWDSRSVHANIHTAAVRHQTACCSASKCTAVERHAADHLDSSACMGILLSLVNSTEIL